MKREQMTRRLPGGAIVATHHGDHDQKTHGNRSGAGSSDREMRSKTGGEHEKIKVRSIEEATRVINEAPSPKDFETWGDPAVAHEFMQNPVPIATYSDERLKKLAAKAYPTKEGTVWDKHGKDMEIDVAAIRTNQPIVARQNVTSQLDRKQTEGRPIYVFKYRDEFIVWDGNHRTTAARMRGRKTIRAKVVDLNRSSENWQEAYHVKMFGRAEEEGDPLYVKPFEGSELPERLAKAMNWDWAEHHYPGGQDHDQQSHAGGRGGGDAREPEGRVAKVKEPSGSAQKISERYGTKAAKAADAKITGKQDAAKGSPEREKYVKEQKASAYEPHDPDGATSQLQYKRPDGTYMPERAELHTALKRERFHGVTKPEGQPIFTQMGGGTASGKSSLPKEGIMPENRVHSDADEYKAQLPDYREAIARGERDAAGFAHDESSDLAKATIAEGVAKGFNVTADGTGDNDFESLHAKMAGHKAAGYKVVAHYVTVDTDTAVARAFKRAEETGRNVSEAVIRENHRNVSVIFPQAIAKGTFDEATLWDTNTDGTAIKVAEYKNGKFTVHEPKLYDRFLAKAHGDVSRRTMPKRAISELFAGNAEPEYPEVCSLDLMNAWVKQLLLGQKITEPTTPHQKEIFLAIKADLAKMDDDGVVVELPFDP